MMVMTISLVMASSLVNAAHCGHDKVRSECTACSEEDPAVLAQVMKLQTAPGWMARRKAARALGKQDWKCHPGAALALADALLHDDKALVRQEAAEALAKMRPCLPAAHEAVARAARCDDCFLARHWAKKALKAIGKTCEGDCSVCGASAGIEEDSALPPSVEPPGPTIRVEPSRPWDASPFQPRVAPMRPTDPLPEALPDRAPADGPALEMPSLPPTNPAPAPAPPAGPGLTGPLSSRIAPAGLKEVPLPIRRLTWIVDPDAAALRAKLAGRLADLGR